MQTFLWSLLLAALGDHFCLGTFPPGSIQRICGLADKDSFQWHIHGGDSETYGQWPWMVSLLNMRGSHYCGGVVVSERWILTAAHCLVGTGLDKLDAVRVGEFNTQLTDIGEELYDVKNLTIHKSFDRTMQTMDNNIGLIELSTPITFGLYVKPTCLPTNTTAPLKTGKRCITLGWGHTDEEEVPASILRVGRVKLIPEEKCKTSDGDIVKFNPSTMMCAGALGTGAASICPGDSGGPLLCQQTNSISEPWEVYGIISWKKTNRKGPCEPTVESFVLSRVTAFTSWINATMARSEE